MDTKRITEHPGAEKPETSLDRRNRAILDICDCSELDGLKVEKKEELLRNYIDCAEGTGFMGKYLYGVNVRTSDDLNKVNPFFASSEKELKTVSNPAPDRTLPKFTDLFGIREMFFYADVDESGNRISSVTIHTLLLEANANRDRQLDEIKAEIVSWLDESEGANFFTANVHNLAIRSSRVYMWLSSEDYYTGEIGLEDYMSGDAQTLDKKNGSSLSNIMAISDDREFLQRNIVSHRMDLINFLFLLKARHLFEQNLQRLKASENSAKAAIMSRNMSHNLGSHVMAYLKQHLNSVQDMIKDNVLNELFTDDMPSGSNIDAWFNKLKDTITDGNNEMKEFALPFLVGLGKFISYLQERQDFIATIATDYSPYFSSVNFKDFIYDELNPDLRYERHRDRQGMKPDNILLGNIAKSEGLARVTCPTSGKKESMSDIVLKFGCFDGQKSERDSNNRLTEKGLAQEADLSRMRRIDVSLPGGVVGRQAFFSIMENVIRNAAKHGRWGDDAGDNRKNLELSFDYYDSAADFRLSGTKEIPFEYYSKDDAGCWQKSKELNLREFLETYYSESKGVRSSELAVFTITDNMQFEASISNDSFERYRDNRPVLEKFYEMSKGRNLTGIRSALLQRYIDRDGKMINENKGIKEMRISAAWMRSVQDSIDYNPFSVSPDDEKWGKLYRDGKWTGETPILLARPAYIGTTAINVNVGGHDYEASQNVYGLQLILCFMKPKKMALLTVPEPDAELRDRLCQCSWTAISAKDYCSPAFKNRSYEFIIFDDRKHSDAGDMWTEVRMISHSRTYRLSMLADECLKNTIGGIIDGAVSDWNASEIETSFLKMLADVHSEDRILISDEKVFDKYKDSGDSVFNIEGKCAEANDALIWLRKDNCVINGKLAPFIYRKHHESDVEFNAFINGNAPSLSFFNDGADKEAVVFVEGITGNNSTDRIVRQEPLTRDWAYSHLHAMKQKVAIFDERLFSKTYRIDEMDIRRAEMSMGQDVPRISKEESLARAFRRLWKDLPKGLLDRLQNSTSSEDEKRDMINRSLERKYRGIFADKMGLANAMKGTYVFNLLKASNHLDIYGYSDNCEMCYSPNDNRCFSKVANVGRIWMEEGTDKVVVDIDRCYRNKFDKISIHQGLLDKVYEMLEIKNNPQMKDQVTLALYEALSLDTSTIEYQDGIVGYESHFLPHLAIHSGRSKPSLADMPQHQPFIQYAAIEHAVLDCKYSLVELLDSARYEKVED